jgi:hypothetical protein
MPLARIITDSAEDSLELTMQLRARGFQVETVTPNEVPTTPADLEVLLEECTPEDVLNKAAQVRDTEDLWVFIAPGALDESTRPMRVIPLVPQVVEAPTASVVVSRAYSHAPVELPFLEPEDDPILAELAQSPERALPQVDSQIRVATQNGGSVKSGVARFATAATPSAAPTPTISASPKVAERPPLKVVTLPKAPREIWQIPEVPERVEPMNLASTAMPTSVARKSPYQIAFRTGPEFWRTASVTAALVVLTGLPIAIVRLQPHLPAVGLRPGTITTQPALFPSPQTASTIPVLSQPLNRSAQPVATKAKKAVRPGRSESAIVNGAVGNAKNVGPRQRPVPSRDEGIIAEDTVVFYDRRPVPAPTKAARQPGVKQYSDAN